MEETTVSVDHFLSVCRACLCDCRSDNGFNIHETVISKDVAGDIISKYASVQVKKEDMLPKQLCQQCLLDLTNCHKFVEKCQKSDQILRRILNKKHAILKLEKHELQLDEIKEEEIDLSESLVDLFDKPDSSFLKQPVTTGEKPCKYVFCNEGFAHEKTGEKPYKCRYCKRGFVQKGRWVTHESMHRGEKPYVCSFCEKGFRDRGQYVIHERTHTGEKPYVCSFCKKGFKDKRHQVVHERRHTGEKPYKCCYCEKRFAERGNKAVHERTHTGVKPYKCCYCEKGFTQRVKQVAHERTHTGERPYKCVFCGKGFIEKGQKVSHERKHSVETP